MLGLTYATAYLDEIEYIHRGTISFEQVIKVQCCRTIKRINDVYCLHVSEMLRLVQGLITLNGRFRSNPGVVLRPEKRYATTMLYERGVVPVCIRFRPRCMKRGCQHIRDDLFRLNVIGNVTLTLISEASLSTSAPYKVIGATFKKPCSCEEA